MPTVCKFNDSIAEACQNASLFEIVNQLYCKYCFTKNDHDVLKQVDWTLMSILTKTDKWCWCKHSYPWSPALHQAYLIHWYWIICLSEQHTKCDMSAALAHICEQLLELLENILTISANLRQAQQTLQEIWCHAHQKWQECLNSLAEAAGQTNDIKKQKLIMHWNGLSRTDAASNWLKTSWNHAQLAALLSWLYLSLAQWMTQINVKLFTTHNRSTIIFYIRVCNYVRLVFLVKWKRGPIIKQLKVT